ncbi:bis(5'-nucleosyl)-tetraphosphatase (symmetrical) YqeK [Lacrimispora sp. 210928-DFI.3.58]|uniref:bis(5'-nucleosyl)-tetraphosphatase (symmetrical) YqeK n=1 Tax=Lacrimispora sp. 210928-DFI.3.58 TaxID=2883214 RepID=UPI0015B5415A|nr:bis(5'-nucleosyl)-tetraphosphatase (symmetrical) YqeK [Lacrimispora sp. 210928-DFI.3.58]MCB7320684.1 bis(5'-nucleosyl)-tetraphosphatase (symmetrical) YqeK [Lacrimispora sp. 210928-DFI.3.58]
MDNQCSQIMILRRKLQSKLAPMRYEHSISVSFTCMNLAMRYGYDLDRAELAGLMHDCGKRYSDEIILKKCLKHGIEVTDAEYKALPVLHAKYGAWLAEHKYGIDDAEVLSAIRCHTTGKPEMSVLDKILYIADYIEPRRYKAENLPVIRRLAYEDLDKTMYAILAGTLDYLKKKGGNIDPMTADAYEYFRKLEGEPNELKGNG